MHGAVGSGSMAPPKGPGHIEGSDMVEKNRLDADRSDWFEASADAMLLL